MTKIGVTGGIGMGKSTAGGILADLGVKVADTDSIARNICEAGQPAYLEILERFGEGALCSVGGPLNRSYLASLVFSDSSARKDLEAILHPRIRQAWEGWLMEQQAWGAGIAAVLIPLLFEKGYELGFDATVAVSCTGTAQRRRLAGRGWDEAQVAARVAAQMPAEEKMRRSNYIVWTEGSLDSHRRQWQKILGHLEPICCPV